LAFALAAVKNYSTNLKIFKFFLKASPAPKGRGEPFDFNQNKLQRRQLRRFPFPLKPLPASGGPFPRRSRQRCQFSRIFDKIRTMIAFSNQNLDFLKT